MTWQRSSFKPRQAATARLDRSDEFASFQLGAATARMATAVDLVRAAAPAPAVRQKTPDRKQQAIRDSARGEECTVRIEGACTFDPAKTIWSHAPLGAGGKGMGIKALDLCGAYCCTACDAVVDGQAPMPAGATRALVLTAWFYGHMRSLLRLRQKGLV